MKTGILVFRVVSTVLLVGLVVTVVHSPKGTSFGMSSFANMVTINIDPESNEVVVSSLMLGFAVSLAGTILSIKQAGSAKAFRWPLIVAAFCFLCHANEIVRLFNNHIQVLISLPIVQVIIDWLSMRYLKSDAPLGPFAPMHYTQPPPVPNAFGPGSTNRSTPQ